MNDKKRKFEAVGVVASTNVVAGYPKVMSSKEQDLQKKYIQSLKDALSLEIAEQVAQFEKRKESWNKELLVREGVALFDLLAKKAFILLGEQVVRFFLPDNQNLPYCNLGHGDMVLITELKNSNPYTCEGTLLEKSKNSLLICLKAMPKNLEEVKWRVDQSVNSEAHKRMMHALDVFANSKTKINGGTMIKNIIVGGVEDFNKAAREPTRFQKLYEGKYPEEFSQWKLNQSQREVIEASLHRKLTLIQGPPGTGKTHTAIHIVRIILHFLGGKVPILCTADTNVAVDNLLQGLSDAGVKALRIGKPVKIREELMDHCLESQTLLHPNAKILNSLRDKERELWGNRNKADESERQALSKIKVQIKQIEKDICDSVINSVQVICATCIGSGVDLLENREFPVVLMDECTQATEPSSLVPLVKGSEHVILLGDHFQLPPTVLSEKAAEKGLRKSLFSRLAECGIEPVLLRIQYRMHPLISQFSSQTFYGGKIEDGVKAEDKPLIKGFDWPNGLPIAFINVDGIEQKSPFGQSKSKMNKVEANLIVQLVDKILDFGDITTKDIGVVTPYNGQVIHLTSLFGKNQGLKPGGKYHRMNIHSVDGYQGREKELIIISTVRSNKEKKVGFLKDWRRLNVAITRARRGLIVVGNQETLSNDEYWNKWLQWIISNKLEMKENTDIQEMVKKSQEASKNGNKENGNSRKEKKNRKKLRVESDEKEKTSLKEEDVLDEVKEDKVVEDLVLDAVESFNE